MSASTERKNRQTARSEGSYAKDINAKKEADKKKKQRTKWIIVGVALVIFFAFAIYLNSGALYRSLDALTVKNTEVTVGDTTISAGERGFSVAECNYVYHMQYISLMNTYGNYASTPPASGHHQAPRRAGVPELYEQRGQGKLHLGSGISATRPNLSSSSWPPTRHTPDSMT